MPNEITSITSDDVGQTTLMLLQSHEARLSKLEEPTKKTLFKKISDNGSVVALFLGLALTFGSIRDMFWIKPEADRVSRIGQFNTAVNSAAKLRQDMLQLQTQSIDPGKQMAISAMITPQILSNISTARAIARDMKDDEFGIPQMTILITEAFTAGDLDSMKDFVRRAVAQQTVSPFLKSEARRYEGKYRFVVHDPDARGSFMAAISYLDQIPGSGAAKAFVLLDLALTEFQQGFCEQARTDIGNLGTALKAPEIPIQQREAMTAGLKSQITQYQTGRCPIPSNVDALLGI